MRNYALSFLQVFVLLSCSSDQTGQEQTPAAAAPVEARLACESVSDDPEVNPNHAVYLSVGEYKAKIAQIAACNPIDSSSYADYQIPAEAIDAVGGWWAGAGHYFYALQESEEVVVYEGMVDEMQVSSSYGYMPIGSFEDGRFIPIPQRPTITGLYTLGGHDSSWVVLVDRIDGEMEAQYLEIEGMLPPEEDLLMDIGNLELRPFGEFAVDTDDLSFDSDWGPGKFVVEDEQVELVFSEKSSHIEDQLVLEKVSN